MKTALIIISSLAGAALLAAPQIHAQGSVVVTLAENPGQETSTLTGTQVETFNNLPLGVDNNVNWAGVGTFNQLYIKNADQYGGATDPTHPNGSEYAVEGEGTVVSTTTLTLSENTGYFGLWWSAGDPSNVLDFYNNNTLVAQFTTASLLGSLTSAYDGNPRNRSLDSSEPFAFINFYGSAGTTWNKIVMTNDSSSGFEADNFTVRQSTYNPTTDGPILPGVPVARVTGTQTTKVNSTAKGAALWGSASAVPGAPAPPFALAAAFGLVFLGKGWNHKRAAASAQA
ncbi:MAG TPA: hypothetical protein VGM54_02685 [Chthoniobacter sp.]|jgi:hypothetical protein